MFCLVSAMASDYQIDETDTELLLHIPPPNSAWKVAMATVSASLGLWYAGVSFYLSLARSESGFSFLYFVPVDVCLITTFIAMRVLYRQVTKKEVTFERHVIGIDYRILGVRVQRKWFSVHQVQEWITVAGKNGQELRLAIKHRDRVVTIAEFWITSFGFA